MDHSGAGSGPGTNGAEDIQDLPAPDARGPAVHARLAVLVEQRSAAIVPNAVIRIAALPADEWVIVSESGITDRDAFPGQVASGNPTHSATAAIGTPVIRVHGDSATVTARMTNTARCRRRCDAGARGTDVFVLRDGPRRRVLTPITPAAPTVPASSA
ncbi:DUF4440 domain-containing protein [Streptomyces sp. NPDC087897]|uniref:DUF4440 domain-containing protein n=1 Tax=Streptomyces sp. NPDC087897 TaxID=3365817 RepID=UPI0037F57379